MCHPVRDILLVLKMFKMIPKWKNSVRKAAVLRNPDKCEADLKLLPLEAKYKRWMPQWMLGSEKQQLKWSIESFSSVLTFSVTWKLKISQAVEEIKRKSKTNSPPLSSRRGCTDISSH